MESNQKITPLEINPKFFNMQPINQTNQFNTPISRQ
jgi:hypothetical protein